MKELKFPEQQYCQELLSLLLTFKGSFSIKMAYVKSKHYSDYTELSRYPPKWKE